MVMAAGKTDKRAYDQAMQKSIRGTMDGSTADLEPRRNGTKELTGVERLSADPASLQQEASMYSQQDTATEPKAERRLWSESVAKFELTPCLVSTLH